LRLRRFAVLLALATSLCIARQLPGVQTLDARPADPLAERGKVAVFLFLRTDCTLGKRYAPELGRLAREFSAQPVSFWMVFPDRTETADAIRSMMRDYEFPGTAVRDTNFTLVKLSRASIAPEAAVFDRNGRLVYHGRIDDRFVDYGKARPRAESNDLEDAIRAALAGKLPAYPERPALGCALADIE
jgi:hypothetical protein